MVSEIGGLIMAKSYEKFHDIIKKKKVKIIDVSRATGISNSTLYEWSAGKYTPKIDKLSKIADFLNVDVNDLIDDDKGVDIKVPQPEMASDCVELLSYFVQLGDNDKAILIDMAKNMSQRTDIINKYMGLLSNPISQ